MTFTATVVGHGGFLPEWSKTPEQAKNATQPSVRRQ
jgi:hypothetical protein